MTNNTSESRMLTISPEMRIGYVSLNVSDLQRSLDFYIEVLGFRAIGKPADDRALLSAEDGGRLVELQQKESAPEKRAGLYHFAILLPERKHLADVLLNLNENSERFHFDGMADHLVSEAIYIRDPDWNGIEIYRDRPRNEWKWNKGKVEMATVRLDTDDLLREATVGGWRGMPTGTTIGHIHLHVRDLAEALDFYRDLLGLDLTATFPGAYFFSAGGYHHHVAANTWLGTVVPQASSDKAGLNHFGMELPDQSEVERILKHVSANANDGFVHDPDGVKLKLYTRQN